MSVFKKTKTPAKPIITVEAIDWTRDRSDVLRIEYVAFPANMRSNEFDLANQLKKGFGLLARRSGCKNPVGYVIAMPLEQACYQGCSTDRSEKKTAYIESLAITPSERTALLRLTRDLFDRLEQKGYERVTMHVETDSNLHNTILGIGGKELVRFDNWQGWRKNFAYLEISLN